MFFNKQHIVFVILLTEYFWFFYCSKSLFFIIKISFRFQTYSSRFQNSKEFDFSKVSFLVLICTFPAFLILIASDSK